MPHSLKSFFADETGQDLVEYGLLVGLFGLSAIASMHSVAASLQLVFTRLGNELTTAT